MTDEQKETLRALIVGGVGVGEFIYAFNEVNPPSKEQDAFLDKARNIWVSDGEIEIDSPTIISDSGEGAYVLAWVWVDN